MDGINVSGSKWQQCISNKSVLYGKKKAGLEEGGRSYFIYRAVYKDDRAESRMGKHGMQLRQYGSDASLMGEGSPQEKGFGKMVSGRAGIVPQDDLCRGAGIRY